MKKIFILLLIPGFILGLGSCEILEGPPMRDNINDPDNELGFTLELSTNSGIDFVHVTGIKSGEFPDDLNYEIIYGIEEDMQNENNIHQMIDNLDFVIEGLVYGSYYNLWLRGYDKEDEEDTIFIKYLAVMPEAEGIRDEGFGSGGIFTFNQAAVTSSKTFDLVSTSDNGIFIGAGSYSPVNSQFILKINAEGGLDNNFNGMGYYQNYVNPENLKCTMLNNDFIAFIDLNVTGPLQYYRNATGIYDTSHNFTIGAAQAYNENQMFVAGSNANVDAQFSVIKFDQNLINTNITEYALDHTAYNFAHPINYSKASDVYCKNDLVYAGGWIEVDTVWERHLYAVILNVADMTVANTLVFNADWDTSQNRIKQIGTTGPMVGPQIAADNNGNVYVVGRGVMSKFRDNNGIFDMDEDWGEQGSIYFPENSMPVDLIIQENDKVIVFMNQYIDMEMPTPTFEKSVIYRFHEDGSQDIHFNGNGFIEQPNLEITGADIKPDGRIIVSGNDSGYGAVQQFQ